MSQGYGGRIAQTRRLLSVAMERDVTQVVLGDLIGSGMGTVSRWETEEMRPRRKWLEAIAKLARDWGVPGVTESWLDYGQGEGPPRFGSPPAKKEGRGAREGLHGERLARPSAVKKKRRSS